MTKAGICGSNLHVDDHGDAFGFDRGCRLGHELVGVVEVGAEVSGLRPGQEVAVAFYVSCGDCHHCP